MNLKLITILFIVVGILASNLSYADGSFLEARVMKKDLGTNFTNVTNTFNAGIKGDDGAGIGLHGRWKFGEHFYTYGDFENYTSDFDVSISDTTQLVAQVQSARTREYEFGIGGIYSFSDKTQFDISLGYKKRKIEVDSFIQSLTSGESIQSSGEEISESGLSWQLGVEHQVANRWQIFGKYLSNQTGQVRITPIDIDLTDDDLFEAGIRFSLTDKWQLGLSWQEGDQDTTALGIRYRF